MKGWKESWGSHGFTRIYIWDFLRKCSSWGRRRMFDREIFTSRKVFLVIVAVVLSSQPPKCLVSMLFCGPNVKHQYATESQVYLTIPRLFISLLRVNLLRQCNLDILRLSRLPFPLYPAWTFIHSLEARVHWTVSAHFVSASAMTVSLTREPACWYFVQAFRGRRVLSALLVFEEVSSHWEL